MRRIKSISSSILKPSRLVALSLAFYGAIVLLALGMKFGMPHEWAYFSAFALCLCLPMFVGHFSPKNSEASAVFWATSESVLYRKRFAKDYIAFQAASALVEAYMHDSRTLGVPSEAHQSRPRSGGSRKMEAALVKTQPFDRDSANYRYLLEATNV